MEYEYLFAKGLFDIFKTKVKGKVFCRVIDDILVVNITTQEGIDYGKCYSDFARKLQLDQISKDGIANEVTHEYKKLVLNTFFY